MLCRHSYVVSEGLGRSEALCPHMILVFVASPDGTQGWDQTFPYSCPLLLLAMSCKHRVKKFPAILWRAGGSRSHRAWTEVVES